MAISIAPLRLELNPRPSCVGQGPINILFFVLKTDKPPFTKSIQITTFIPNCVVFGDQLSGVSLNSEPERHIRTICWAVCPLLIRICWAVCPLFIRIKLTQTILINPFPSQTLILSLTNPGSSPNASSCLGQGRAINTSNKTRTTLIGIRLERI